MCESELSESDRQALAFVRGYVAEHDRAPSYVEVGRHLKLGHPNNAKRNCDRLVAGGFLPRSQVGGGSPGRPRALSVDSDWWSALRLPFRGRVSCGAGCHPENRDGESIDLRDMFKGLAESAVFVACGDSMTEAHIDDGDYLVVREDPDPPEGSVVIAMVGEDMVCKRLAKKGQLGVLLEPRHAGYPAIVVDITQVPFCVLGVLKRVIKKV